MNRFNTADSKWQHTASRYPATQLYGDRSKPSRTLPQQLFPLPFDSASERVESLRVDSRQDRINALPPPQRRRQEEGEVYPGEPGVRYTVTINSWRRVKDGYVDASSNHYITDKLIKEGKGGYYFSGDGNAGGLTGLFGKKKLKWYGPYYGAFMDSPGKFLAPLLPGTEQWCGLSQAAQFAIATYEGKNTAPKH